MVFATKNFVNSTKYKDEECFRKWYLTKLFFILATVAKMIQQNGNINTIVKCQLGNSKSNGNGSNSSSSQIIES